MQEFLFQSTWRIYGGKCYKDANEQLTNSFLAADGVASDTIEDELNILNNTEDIINRLLRIPNAWSIFYYRTDISYVFVGRDIFGRYSLVWSRTDDGSLIVSPSVNSSYETEWGDVPYGQVTAIDLNRLSAYMISFLDKYPDSADDAWKKTFTSFTHTMSHLQYQLTTLNNNLYNSNSEYSQLLLSKLLNVTKNTINSEDSEVAVAFSGGIDSLLIAYAVLKSTSPSVKISLVNAAFGRDGKAWNEAPDRKRALVAWEKLKNLDDHNQMQLILVNVTPEKLEKHRKKSICKATPPAVSVLDDSLACVLWFALKAKGTDYGSGNYVKVSARIFFVGSGADELFAGYARHRTRFEKEGIQSVITECEMELRRLGNRNGGRDARIAKQLHRILVAPFLIDEFAQWANSIPLTGKCDLSLPRGEGEKKIIRDCLKQLGLPHNAPKQAMQFGSRMAKITNLSKQIKGSDLSEHLQSSCRIIL